MLYEPRILFKGPVTLSQFAPAVTGGPWPSSADYDDMVQTSWRRRVESAAARGHHLWDGTHYRLTHIADIARAGPLRLGTVSFRYIATYRFLHEQHQSFSLDPLHHISTAALLLTADGFYLFGKRAINGSVDLIGGGLQTEDGESTPDFERNIRKEIREETGIVPADLHAMNGLGVVMSTTSNILVIAHVATALTAAQVQTIFARRDDDEMAELVMVPRAEISAYLRSLTDYRPLVADLL